MLCLPAAVGDLRVTSLGEETAVVAVPAGDVLARYATVTPEQIGERPLIILPRAQNPAFFDGVISSWRSSGLLPAYVETGESCVAHALLAVAAGTGVAVLPASSAQGMSVPGVRLLALEPGPTCEVALVRLEEASTSVTGFVTLAARIARAAAKRERLAALAA